MKLTSRALSVYRDEGFVSLGRQSIGFAARGVDQLFRPAINRLWEIRNGPGTSVLDYEWDNLLLLDACRFDYFNQTSKFERDLTARRTSLASCTPDYLHQTFAGAQLHDTVYLTANPQPLKFRNELDRQPVFHDMISLLPDWDPETQTIEPDVVRKAATDVQRQYPDKRLIVHFLQPHAPFLGPMADSIRETLGRNIGGLDPGRDYTELDPKNIEPASYHDALNDNITPRQIRTAYRETLSIVLEECETLVDELPGKTALTSDHGELLGERVPPSFRHRWEHPCNVRTDALCVVPFIEFNDTERRQIRAEQPVSPETDDKEVTKRLRSLGYMK